MAVTIASKTSGSGSGTSGNTASVTPGSNKLMLLAVSSKTTSSTDPNIPSISGNGLTWVQVGSSVVFDPTSSSRRRITLFRALGASPSTGAITISFSGQSQSTILWTLDEVSGMDTSGTNGSGAIVQSNTNNSQATPITSFSVTLSAFADINNATYGCFAQDGSSQSIEGSGFTKYGDANNSSDFLWLMSEFKDSNDTSVDVTIGGGDWADTMGGIAVEIKAAAVTGTYVGSYIGPSGYF